MLAQRIFGLACGHADANDADRLADDPIHKLLLGRDPVVGDSLGSSRRSRGLKITWASTSSMPWGTSWRRASSSGINNDSAVARAA